MAIWRTVFHIWSLPNGHYYLQRLSSPTQQVQIFKKSAPNGHYFLQRAVTPDWMGSIALWKQNGYFFWRAEQASDDINSHLFLMNKKGLMILLDGLITLAGYHMCSNYSTTIDKSLLAWCKCLNRSGRRCISYFSQSLAYYLQNPPIIGLALKMT